MAVAQDTSSQSSAAGDSAITDQQLSLLRRDIRLIKKQLIAANLTLMDSEATKFWQVYEQYSAETGKINDTRSAIIKEYSDEYGTLTDDQADNLIRRWLDTDIEQTKLRQRYVPIFRGVLPGKKAATFFQLDRRISTMIDVQLTSQLPLAQSQKWIVSLRGAMSAIETTTEPITRVWEIFDNQRGLSNSVHE